MGDVVVVGAPSPSHGCAPVVSRLRPGRFRFGGCVVVDPPVDLTEDEAGVWALVAGEVSGSVPAELLRAWCATVVELRAAELWVRENGTVLTLRDDKGNVRSVVQAPKYVQVRALRADLVKLADALALSPRLAAKVAAGVSVGGGDGVDELARLRAGRRSGT